MPLSLTFLATLVSLFVSTTSAKSQPSSSFDLSSMYPSGKWLNEAQTFRLWWKFIPKTTTSSQDLMEFAIEARTTGWVAMGISPNGQMPNSDIIVGWVNSDGSITVQDRNTMTTGRTEPTIDEQQNIELVGGGQSNGWTVIQFRRAVLSCETNDLDIPIGTARVLFAFSPTNTIGPRLDYHGPGIVQKGGRSLNLRATGRPMPSLAPEAVGMNVFINRFKVLETTTTYACQLLELPHVAAKHHIVEIHPFVRKNNSAIVHHIVLFSCPGVHSYTSNATDPHLCGAHNMPEVNDCLSGEVIVAWAVGGEPLIFPSNVGLPFGGSHQLRWVLLEIHYDNPQHLRTVYDSSGVTLKYTPRLREFDVSMQFIALDVSKRGQFIPPRYPGLALNTAFVTSECTRAAMAANNVTKVTVLMNMLHSHVAGRQMILRHIRNGVELEPIDSNPSYDFDYQQTIPMFRKVEIEAGDELLLECRLDTSSRSEIVYGGLQTHEEMCQSFLYIYPALTWTHTFVGFHDQLFRRFGPVNNTFVRLEGDVVTHFDVSTPQAKTFYDNLWIGNAERQVFCLGDNNGQLVPLTQEFMHPSYLPQIRKPFVAIRNNTCFTPSLVPPSNDNSAKKKGSLFALRESCDEKCVLALIVLVCVFGVGCVISVGLLAWNYSQKESGKARLEPTPSHSVVATEPSDSDEENPLENGVST